MSGKEYTEQALRIGHSFEELVQSTKSQWTDEQARNFEFSHVANTRKALYEIQFPIESIIDLLDRKLEEIKRIANG